MKRLEFIKKTGLATVGLPLFSSFELSKECLFVEDQVEREKFDFELYEKTHYGSLNFIRPNGNIVFSMGFNEEGGGTMEEIVNKYPFYTLYKEYYPDGYIKVQKTFIPDALAIGKSYHYSKEGKLTVVDEDKQYENFKYTIDDVLLFLQEKGQLNIKGGTLWYNEQYRFAYSINYTKLKGKTLWLIKINNAIPFDPAKHSISIGYDQPKFMYVYYLMDVETGRVYTEEEFFSEEEEEKPKTTTFQGKTYTEEEWKAFEQEQWEKYQAKQNHKSFWERLFG